MTKTVYYVYLGTNGTITSPVHLEDIYYTRKYFLQADEGLKLTRDNKNYVESVMIPEGELENWREVKAPTGQK
jgi:hypothetical protein